jgi:hypothetical protein
LFPACTGFGEATFVTDKLGPVAPTIVLTEAVLFAEIGSIAEEPTETVPVITVPFAVPAATFTTRLNALEVNAAMFALVHTTLPVAPTAAFTQLHPAGTTIDARVVFAGIEATTVALSAALGPLLVTTPV